MGIVTEEAEETVFWLDFAARASMLTAAQAAPTLEEARQLLAIFITAMKTAKANLAKERG